MGERVKKDYKKDLLTTIIEAIDEKKAQDIVVLNLSNISSRICDYFVICTGTSNIHVESIVSHVELKVKKILGEYPFSIEGLENAYWVILDYINVVVHVMQPQARGYYELEKLWADAELTKINTVNYG